MDEWHILYEYMTGRCLMPAYEVERLTTKALWTALPMIKEGP